ncbi:MULTISPECIES: pirin family protein [Rhodomicrobium]|uniref:pirin family protein n=2 Tax=Rhodomicrobium TaxID=1068 RepID=UPI001FDAC359|nr:MULTISPECIES: pirin family protein [Rhodomicrobium]
MNNISKVDVVMPPGVHNLGAGFEVRRALPSAKRQMVGPFIFFDAFGPAVFGEGDGVDTRPHAHIGLATLTYLIEGDLLHRDSAGHVQAIGPSEANLMTAGPGIVHSERTPESARVQGSTIFGQQVWLALPKAQEEAEPSFAHHAASALPRIEGEGITATLIAGSGFGRRYPVSTFSDTIYADVALARGARFQIAAEHAERAIYLVVGSVRVVGQEGEFSAGELIVFKPGSEIVLKAGSAVRLMLIGGEPLPEKRFIHWNFVSSSMERIEQAMSDWRERHFPGVPGETEFIALPTEVASR